MAAPQNFRTAFNGFNRDDVVNYISFITTKHENQVNQLRSEMDELRQELAERPEAVVQDETELAALREQVTRLQAQLHLRDETIAQLQQAAAVVPAAPVRVEPSLTEQELSAYRRAESAERRAMERVDQMYARANGVLADTVSRLEENTGKVNQVAEQVRSDLAALEQAVIEAKTALKDSAAVIASIGPET